MSIDQAKKQWVWIIAIITISIVLSAFLLFGGKEKASKAADEDAHADEQHGHDDAEGADAEDESLNFTSKQLIEFGVKLAQVELGDVEQKQQYPAKLVVNTDQQAHVEASFAGRVESVAVTLGQDVKKGQALATLFIPDLVDQQANLSIAQEAFTLASQDYHREKQLFDQGISARQDYQRAYNAYRQAEIQVQAARSRLSALGASSGSQGRYVIKAPFNGVITKKDIVVGENISADKQLFIIDQLDQLWVEFILPSAANIHVQPNQEIEFKSLQTNNLFKARVQALTTEADSQTGRLQVRAKVLTPAQELRPNLMVNVLLTGEATRQPVLRVAKAAIQQIDGQQIVFVAKTEKEQIHLMASPVQLGNYSSDGQWVEIKSGLTVKQQYVSQGSFLLKSEMEKGEAEHAH